MAQSEGSIRAPLVLIGEAYGRWEGIYDRPFVGPSYTDKLLPWWNNVRLSRSQFFIMNVWDQGQPPRGIDAIPEYEMRAAMDRCHDRLAAHEGPDGNGPIVIVPTGNYALYMLTGKGRVSFHQRDGKWLRPGITSWRGSILEYQDRKGRRIKVIPTIHPAATMPFRQPGYEWVCQRDWQRIADDLKFRELRLPQRTKMIAPSKAEAIEWIRWTRETARQWSLKGHPMSEPWGEEGLQVNGRMALSLDVETPTKQHYETRQKESAAANGKCRGCGHTKRWHLEANFCTKAAPKKAGGDLCTCQKFAPTLSKPKRVKIDEEAYLGCIGYSWDPKIALCIPTTLDYWQNPDDWAAVKAEMAALHADTNIDIFGQNFPFDSWWCAEEGMPLHALPWDLLKMHRVQRPWSEWHDLAFQASIDTREPYWKDEAKDPQALSRWSHNKEALWSYNCTDNCVQRELLPLRIEALRKLGRLEYYLEVEAPIDTELLALTRHGIRCDEAGRAEEFERVTLEAKSVAAEVNDAAGRTLFGPKAKGISNAKLKDYLYGVDGLRLPEQYTKNSEKKKVVSVNVVSIKRLMERFPDLTALQEVGRRVLRHRRLVTIGNFLKEDRTLNGRQYAMFRQDTLLGRLKSSKTPKGEGANLQNVDRRLRKFYLPDTGEEIE